MKRLFLWGAMGWIVFLVTGCARITTQVVEKPRLDQEIEGNQGYLKGSGPDASSSRKTTRKIIQTDIELPTARELNPWRVRKPAAPPAPSAQAPIAVMPEEEVQLHLEEEMLETKPIAAAPSQTYRVQTGDSLEKIASKMYGDSRKWRAIYEANRDRLPSPNRIYPGQELEIPDLEGEFADRAGSSDLK